MKNKNIFPKIILILGMHRSGTSLIAQLIAKMGINLGDDLMEANEYNSDGYWESNALVELHEKMLKFTGNEWYAPINPIDNLLLQEKFGEEAQMLISAMDVQAKDWCWKDPRMIVFLDFWQELLKNRDVLYVLPFRNPHSIIDSLLKRDNMPPIVSCALFEYSAFKIFSGTESVKNRVSASYDDLLINPSAMQDLIKTVTGFLPELKISDFQSYYNEIIKASLNHAGRDPVIKLTPEAQEFYKIYQLGFRESDSTKFVYNPEPALKLMTLYRQLLSSRKPYYFAQLFYSDDPRNFSEQNSKIIEVQENYFSLVFNPETGQPLKFVRIDPLNDYVHISSPEITLSRQGERILVNPLITSNALIEYADGYVFDTQDPQLILDLSDSNFHAFNELKINITILEKGLAALPSVLQFHQEKLKQLINEKSLLKATLQTSNLRIEEKKELISGKIEEIETKNNLIESIERQLEIIGKRVELVENELNKQEIYVSQLSGINRALQDQLSKETTQTLELQAELQNKQELISSLNDLVSEQNGIKEELINEVEISQRLLSEMHGENSRQNAQLAELTSELNRIHASKSYKFFVALSNPACALKRIPIIIKLLALISAYKNKRIVLKSGYFDEIWYLGHYPDVGNSGIDPLRHFIQFGGSEKRNPGPAFDTLYYLQSNSDVRLSGMNPLLHFLRYGNKEGRLPKAGMVTMTPPLPDSSKARSYTSGIGTKLLERIKASGDLQLISQSGLFDSAYYLRNNEDVRASGINPLRHYYFHGWLEGRSPGNNFDDQYYLSANPDVRKSEINPLLHYVKYGKKEGRLPKAFEINEADCKNEADITELLTATAIDNHLKISVVCHLYYPEMLDEILAYLAHFQVQFDLIITTTHEKHGLIQQKILDKNPGYRVNIVDFENRGRDIGPFVSVLSSHLMEYDVICKIHTKSSIHDINLKGWRKYLYDQLLGNSQIIETILNHFQNDSELGMVWPLPFPYLASMGLDKGWGPPNGREQNFSRAIKTFPEMEFINIDENISFPIGSMFWFRPQSLRFIASKLLKVEDFEPETQQIDGTLAHAIERTLGIMVKKTGYTTKTVFFSNELINRNIFKNRDILYTESVLFVAHDLYLAGAEMILLNILNWFFRHTALKLFVLAIKKGNDGGKMLPEYQKVCSVIHLGEIAAANNPDETFKKIREITGEINLIYGNTIISAGIYDMLKGFNAPYITHIHELEKSINKYVSVEVLGILKKYTQTYIACSQPVVDNLVNNHGISADHVEKVYEFIHTGRDPLPDRNLQRMGWDMPINKTIIWSCGTIYWRKGPDLFIKTAKLLKDAGFKDFVFYWIGENFWNAENAEWGKWSTWEDYIIQNNLSDAVVFMGGKADPREYFKAGDIFYLPSREDPFPVVCLEAAECGLPIICFDGAGGIQEFVGTNAGMIVPYEDISAAGQAIGELIKDQNRCKSIGLKAREKILSQYTDDIAVPEILKISRNAMKSNPLISIIVPVYNQARFLHQRIESILNQTFRDVEILILDDCSSDESLLIASQYKKHPSVSILQNSTNSGSPFRQWKKGIEIAKGDFIWIAEGDDWSEPGFLESLLPYFNDSEVVIAYCNSNRIDESENVSENFYTKSAHYNGLVHEPMRWAENYIAEGLSEINNALCIRNTIPNASAVLWRSKHLKCVDFEDCTNFKSCGDWFAYVSVLKQGKIAYHAQSLNYHRIHAASVVAQTKASASETLPDYYKMHQYIVKNHNIPYASFQLMLNSITNGLRHSYPGITDYEFERLYCTSKLQELYG